MKTAEYELVLMLDAAAPEQARETLAADARSRIETAGEIRHAETWGIRKLAYEIEQRAEADYRFFRFQTEAPNLDDLRHALRIADGVLRFRIFEVDPKAPLMTPPEITLGPSRERDGRGRGRRRDEEPAAEAAEATEAEAEPTEERPAEAEAPAESAPAAEPEAPAAEPEAPAAEPEAPAAEPEAPAAEPEAPAAEPEAPAAEPEAPAAEPEAAEPEADDGASGAKPAAE